MQLLSSIFFKWNLKNKKILPLDLISCARVWTFWSYWACLCVLRMNLCVNMHILVAVRRAARRRVSPQPGPSLPPTRDPLGESAAREKAAAKRNRRKPDPAAVALPAQHRIAECAGGVGCRADRKRRAGALIREEKATPQSMLSSIRTTKQTATHTPSCQLPADPPLSRPQTLNQKSKSNVLFLKQTIIWVHVKHILSLLPVLLQITPLNLLCQLPAPCWCLMCYSDLNLHPQSADGPHPGQNVNFKHQLLYKVFLWSCLFPSCWACD